MSIVFNNFTFCYFIVSSRLFWNDSPTRLHVDTSIAEKTQSKEVTQKLTQKEYYIAIRNRLFALDEELWMYKNIEARPGSKIDNISSEHPLWIFFLFK